MSLLHPLAKPFTQLINCHNQAFIDFKDPQPVLLDGYIYMKGWSAPDRQNPRLWKYSIQSNVFSELMFPNKYWRETEYDRYLLTSVNSNQDSNLLLIHANFTKPVPAESDNYDGDEPSVDQWIDEVQSLKLHTYELLCDNKWKDNFLVYSHRSPDPLPVKTDLPVVQCFEDEFDADRARDPTYWGVSAASNHNHLLVTFFRTDKYNDDEHESKKAYGNRPFISITTLVFNLPDYTSRKCHIVQLEQSQSYNSDNKITRPFIFVHDDDMFVKIWDRNEGESLTKYSIKSLISRNHSAFTKLYRISALTYSNLTLLGNQPVIAVSSTNTELDYTYLCALSSYTGTCIELATVNYQFDPAPIIMGSSESRKFIAIGMLKVDSQPSLHVLRVVPQGAY